MLLTSGHILQNKILIISSGKDFSIEDLSLTAQCLEILTRPLMQVAAMGLLKAETRQSEGPG